MKTCVNFFAVVLLLVQLSVVTTAQQAPARNPTTESNSDDWKRYLSLHGRFSVLLPGAPVNSDETVQGPAGPFVLHRSSVRALSEYAVMYADYPKQLTEKLSVDAIFDKAAMGGTASLNSKVLSSSTTALDGYPARLRTEVLPDGTLISTKMVLAGERLYIVVGAAPAGTATDAQATRLHDESANKFFNSFRLVTPRAIYGEFETIQRAGMILYVTCLPLDLNCPQRTGPRIHGRPIKAPEAERPLIARAAHASGDVAAQVIVDEQGNVIAAQAVSGHPLLHGSALEAARKAKFTPTLIGNEPVKVIALLVYHFRDR